MRKIILRQYHRSIRWIWRRRNVPRQIIRQALPQRPTRLLQRPLPDDREHLQPCPRLPQDFLQGLILLDEFRIHGVGANGGQYGGGRERAGQNGREARVRGGQRDDGLRLNAEAVGVDGGGEAQAGQDVVQEVQGGHGGEVPA